MKGIVESVRETSRGRSLDIEVQAITDVDSVYQSINPIIVRITVASLFPELKSGDLVVFNGIYKPVRSDTDLPDEFDPSVSLLRKGISTTLFVEPENLIVIGQATGLYWSLQRYRARISDVIYNSGLNDQTAAFLNAVLVGETENILPDTRHLFSVTGQAHVLALSGTHVLIIASILSIILFPLALFRFNRLKIIIVILSLWIFAVLTGLSPSVTRAVIMTSLLLGSVLLERRNSSINALMAAAILILLFDPDALYQISFQLSFIAVLAILLLNERINPVLPKFHYARVTVGILLLPIVTVTGTAVLSAYYFHIIPVLFILASVPVGILFTLIVGGGVVILLLDLLNVSHGMINVAVEYLYDTMMNIMTSVSRLPGSFIENVYPSLVTVILSVCLLTVLAAWLYYRRKVWGIAFALLIVTMSATEILSMERYPDAELFITRETLNTNFLLRDKNKMALVSTAKPTMMADEADKCRFKYSDYMGRRGVDSLEVAVDTFSSGISSFAGRRLFFGRYSFVIVRSENDLRVLPFTPDYAVICRGFRGNIADVVNSLSPRTVILSYDLHSHRHDRYLDELEQIGIDVFSVRRDGCFHLYYNY